VDKTAVAQTDKQSGAQSTGGRPHCNPNFALFLRRQNDEAPDGRFPVEASRFVANLHNFQTIHNGIQKISARVRTHTDG
jgi:hypothetical protein